VSDCGCRALAARGDPKGPSAGMAGLSKARRSKRTPHCVVAKKSGRVFGCYAKAATAKKVARGMGPGFGLRRS
jgi:hypothetical protein